MRRVPVNITGQVIPGAILTAARMGKLRDEVM